MAKPKTSPKPKRKEYNFEEKVLNAGTLNIRNFGAADITIDPELERWLIKRTEEEMADLERSIKEKGIEKPLDVWNKPGSQKPVLVDGYGRLVFAKKYGLLFKVTFHEFRDIEEAKLWMVRNQNQRRNLDDKKKAYYIGYEYSLVLQNKSGLNAYYDLPGGQIVHSEDGQDDLKNSVTKNSQKLGLIYHCNEKTIRRAYAYYQGITRLQESHPELAYSIRDGRTVFPANLIERVANQKIPKSVKDPVSLRKWIEDLDRGEEPKKVSTQQARKQIKSKLTSFLSRPSQQLRDEIMTLMDKLMISGEKEN
jgi:hypothetical protein